jgi:hypothetical protein
VSGPCFAAVKISFLRGQCLEERFKVPVNFAFSPDHQAVADFKAPNASADPDVQIVDAPRFEFLGMAEVILVKAVSTFYDDIPFVEQTAELVDMLVGRFARGKHKPNDPGGLQNIH